MGRIRTVKPELIQQPWFATLSDAAARTYYGLLGVVDDFGRCAASPSFIAGQIFWGRQRSANAIGRQLGELERAGIIRRYTARGGEYLEIVGWFDKGGHLYQQINKPQGERFPAPESDYDRPVDGPDDRPADGPDPKTIRNESELPRTRAIPPSTEPVPAPAEPAAERPDDPPDRHKPGTAGPPAVKTAAEPEAGPPSPTYRAQGPLTPEELAQHREVGRLAESMWDRTSASRVEIATELGLTGIIALPVLSPVHEPDAFRELRARIREEGPAARQVCDHVHAVLCADARNERDVEWLGEKAFLKGSWREARNRSPGSQRRKRDGPGNVTKRLAATDDEPIRWSSSKP